MTIRKITGKDDYKASLVSAVAFEYGFDYIKERDAALKLPDKAPEKDAGEKESTEKITNLEKLPSDAAAYVTWGAFDENDVCFSAVSVPPYTVRFDGTYQLMGGIGGVSSLPHYRRRGGIRECMRTALSDMYENGYTLSYLYPFSRAYYRKFGYENGMETRTYTLEFTAIKRYNIGGSIEMLLPGDESSALTDIYNRFYQSYNYSVVRREYDNTLSERNTVSEKRYTYIWKNNSGVPMGFMMFTNDDGVLNCTGSFGNVNGFICCGRDALCALLEFAATAFVPNYHAIRFTVPADIDLTYIINEGNNAECRLSNCGMARVVNADKLLSICSARGRGTLVIDIKDEMLPQNSGIRRISWGEGQRKVERLPDGSACDIVCDIGAFTALISGFATFETIPFMPGVTVINENAPFDGLFIKKKSMIIDLF